MSCFPQILLLGNGLNRAFGGEDWSKLLENIHVDPKISIDKAKPIPFPLQAVLLTGDQLDITLKENVCLFQGIRDIAPMREVLCQLLSIPFDHILTTNYSYELERVALKRREADGVFCKRITRHTDAVNRIESQYLLHTYNEVDYQNRKHKIWHIHGEARKPQSIVLGHYYYGNLLGKYMTELQSRKNKQQLRQGEGLPPLILSWVDAFIMGDVYVLGFGFDFSEMDLWWLLNRKKREKADHGKLVFYSPMEGNETKATLINAYGAQAECLGFYTKPADYKAFYKAAIEDIGARVSEKTAIH